MELFFHSSDIDIRTMHYDDIPFICKADGDESEGNTAYLKRQLEKCNKNVII